MKWGSSGEAGEGALPSPQKSRLTRVVYYYTNTPER